MEKLKKLDGVAYVRLASVYWRFDDAAEFPRPQRFEERDDTTTTNSRFRRMSTGELLPCSAEAVTAELLGDTLNLIEPHTIQEALKAVVYYFREEHEETSVSVDQFSSALGKVLQGFGFDVVFDEDPQIDLRVEETDTARSPAKPPASSTSCFSSSWLEVRSSLRKSPNPTQFNRTRECVKSIVGAERWCDRCRWMHGQIVSYLRTCLEEDSRENCALVIR